MANTNRISNPNGGGSRLSSPMPPTSILKKGNSKGSINPNSVTINIANNETRSVTYKCSWCMDILKEPIQLSSSCSHYGCTKCVNMLLNFEKLKRCCKKLAKSEDGNMDSPYEIPCPCCPKILTLPYEKVHAE